MNRVTNIAGIRGTDKIGRLMRTLRRFNIVADVVGDVATCTGTPADFAAFDKLDKLWLGGWDLGSEWPQKRFMTTIELGHRALDVVGPVLEKVGWVSAGAGGGSGIMQIEKRFTSLEIAALRVTLGEALFDFDVQEIVE